ncbi:acyl-CoA synthetase [Rhabdothermincola salaria]|uniref:acyl-CoA synthetase n=1 Tax=Rhabdothermincola salaria TaxID=2903142 RepID=UPI001E43783A|nr:acyl-CoA synthetase [Rhabdothermincola salaria]MCD9622321.1 acyl-CoA synthetase [Rhabdothermincola salaria]
MDDDTPTTDDLPLFTDQLGRGGDRPAIVDPLGTISYAALDGAARALAAQLLAGSSDLDGSRVIVLCRPGRQFVAALAGCWHAGATAVPLHPDHPVAELSGLVADADPVAIVSSEEHRDLADQLAAGCSSRVVAAGPAFDPRSWVADAPLPSVSADRPALMVFTSGTTGRPKGAVHTHASLRAQITAMVEAWGWTGEDRTLLVLPLHHVHGIVNVALTPLWVGAVCEAPGGFDAMATWERLGSGEISVFMAVPTIYARLIATWEAADPATRDRWSAGAARARLMVSGSAALPVSVLERWRSISGQELLERYGMTEVGMALGNPLERRVPGHVGVPFPGVRTRLVDDHGADVPDGEPGELLLQGPQLFAGYWNRPEATAEAFTDGWFRTGDVAVRHPEGFRLLGRSSVDILKTGGEKVSALEIEEVYRTHPAIADCAVVGLPDEEWGDRVAMAVVPADAAAPMLVDELRAWGKERLAPAKVPTRYLVVGSLPRNVMGKVTKPAVVELFDA